MSPDFDFPPRRRRVPAPPPTSVLRSEAWRAAPGRGPLAGARGARRRDDLDGALATAPGAAVAEYHLLVGSLGVRDHLVPTAY
ncbi:MAG: hypothetical protein R2711_18895 [Acidimicrobiales bacterium]